MRLYFDAYPPPKEKKEVNSGLFFLLSEGKPLFASTYDTSLKNHLTYGYCWPHSRCFVWVIVLGAGKSSFLH